MDQNSLRDNLRDLHSAGYAWAVVCCRRDEDLAAEVIQELYVAVLRGQARFDGRSALRTWLFAVIRNIAARKRRWAWLQRIRADKLAKYAPRGVEAESSAHSAERAEQAGRLLAALDRLAPRQREVLTLTFYHDLSIAEAAKVMGVALGSARTHYERGKAALRVLLDESEVRHDVRERRRRQTSTELSGVAGVAGDSAV